MDAARDPFAYYSRFLGRFDSFFRTREFNPENCSQLKGRLRKHLPGKVDVLFFSPTGEIAQETSLFVPQSLFRKFFCGYLDLLKKHRDFSSLEKGFMRSFFGPFVPIGVNFHGQFIHVASFPEPRYLYFSPPSPKGNWILLFSPSRPIWEIALFQQVQRAAAGERRLKAVLRPRSGKEGKDLASLRVRGISAQTLADRFVRRPYHPFWLGSNLFARRTLANSHEVVARLLCPEVQEVRLQKKRVWGALVLSLLIIGMGVYFQCRVFDVLQISIRGKILFAFLMTSGLPLLIMGAVARNYLVEKEAILTKETHAAAEKILRGVDHRFQAYLDQMENGLNLFVYREREDVVDSRKDFLARLPSLLEKYAFDLAYLFDGKGKKVFHFISPDFSHPLSGSEATFSKYAQALLRKINRTERKTEAEERSTVGEAAGAGIESLVDEGSLGAGQINPYEFQSSRILFATLSLLDKFQRAQNMVFLGWDRAKLEEKYIKKAFQRHLREYPNVTLVAIPSSGKGESIPPGHPFHAYIREIAGQLLSGRAVFRDQRGDGRQCRVITGLRGRDLMYFTLLAFSSNRQNEALLAELRWNFGFIALFVLALSVLLSLGVARLILQPMQEIQRGIEAVERRNFLFRCREGNQDELGDLSRFLNLVLSESEDLEVAQSVQEHLLPRQSLTSGTWQIMGACTPTSRVGGDYFEYFRPDPKKLAFIIGDVAGHGVPAALVVAMAKALTVHPDTPSEPGKWLQMLNQVFLTVLKRKRMMTCFAGLFDLETQTLTYANAGHIHPLLLRQGAISSLTGNSLPIGAVAKWSVKEMSVPLLSGDVLVLFTDGSVEAVDTLGNTYGFDCLPRLLPKMIGDSAEKTLANIQNWFWHSVDRDLLSDDVTFVVLQSGDVPVCPECLECLECPECLESPVCPV